MSASSDSRHMQVLKFWHKVEFFVPFDLRGQVLQAHDAEWNVKRISVADMDALTPESSGDFWRVARVPSGKEVLGFDLYLGVFDKSLLAAVTDEAIGQVSSEALSIEQEERGDLEGETCFAKIQLNASGEPVLDQISVSTVPWALGTVSTVGVDGLKYESFQASLKSLQNDLRNFQSRREYGRQSTETLTGAGTQVLPLNRADIQTLLEIFRAWAGFEPGGDKSYPAVIRALVGKNKHKAGGQNSSGAEVEEEGDDESPPPDEVGIDILNSFYIQDIERAIASLMRGEKVWALNAYLTPQPSESRVDVYSPAGTEQIVDRVAPGRVPSGRWLDEPSHAMSLMQQFAINNALSDGCTEGLFSVNGPPGTGKTTLLRDIFSENITKRARVLARFDSATDAFQTGRKPRAEFEGETAAWSLALLKPELTGFEMVVASSNNAAVNNISADLPKARSIGAMNWQAPCSIAWRERDGKPRISYLRPVAIRVASQTSSGAFADLGPDDTPWGLISCALGNRTNRRKFAQRFGERVIKRDRPPNDPDPKGYDPKLHQSFWEWREKYSGPGFFEARRAFVELDEAVRERRSRLERFASLSIELRGHTEFSYVGEQARRVSDREAAADQAKNDVLNAQKASARCIDKLATLRDLDQLIPVPSVMAQWLAKIPSLSFWNNPFRDACRVFQVSVQQNQAAQRACLLEKLDIDARLELAETCATQTRLELSDAVRALDVRVEEWRSKDAERLELQRQFPKAAMPVASREIELPHWQMEGIWFDANLNDLRSKLFAAALKLHEAWLAEVSENGKGFAPNIYAACALLHGKRLTAPEHALAIWQSLFMIVPVVSSTFASIASQFKELGAGALGWMFIDEAGQAVPQAAVGALWRAKRAIVVGDPLQIEPVFTVPVKLIEALAHSASLPDDMRVLPHKASVQNLADAANLCGTEINGAGDVGAWVGSPLRVHRRCSDPMFRVANAIAYDDKMIFGLEGRGSLPDSDGLGPSAWVHVSGATEGRHVVPAQVELVTRAVKYLHQRNGKLPLIYIISPFKRIKQAVQRSLLDLEAWQAAGIQSPARSELSKWCSERVGTVHTFQGKEESAVWMVLGCDGDGEGAVAWAASKPNILNVALTRAKHRFVMIGDVRLWGGKPYFQEAACNLPEISAQDFMCRMSRMSRQALSRHDGYVEN